MMPIAGGISRTVSASVLAATLSACASYGTNQPQVHSLQETRSPPDAIEKLNRSVFERNQQLNHAVVYPAAKTYRDNVPEPVRDSVDAFTRNLNEPFVFTNNLLQLRFPAAATTLGRFLVNSTVGIGGLIDVASTEGLARQTGDFGQTLYVWGIRNSEYMVLPLIGPTNVRDAFGNGVELGAQTFVGTILPTSAAAAASYVGTAGTVASPIASLSRVGEMEELERSSLDFYSMLRSVVEQKRGAELRDALKESLWSGVPGLEDRNGGEAGQQSASPALASPALEPPASSSPALEVPIPPARPAPIEEPEVPKAEPSSAGWTVVIEQRPAAQ